MTIGVVADGFRSATAAAMCFAQAGHSSTVWFESRIAPPPGAEVIAIDSDSRNKSATEGECLSRAAAVRLAEADILFHAVQTSMPGRVERDILAALAVSGRKQALFVPGFNWSFAENQHDGHSLQRRPPMTGPLAAKLFPSLHRDELRHLPISAVRSIRRNSLPSCDARMIVAEGQDPADIDRLLAAVTDTRDVMFCGSAGVANAIAKRFAVPAWPRIVRPQHRRILIVIPGSSDLARCSRRWLRAARDSFEIGVDCMQQTLSNNNAVRAIRRCGEQSDTIILHPQTALGTNEETKAGLATLGRAAAELVRTTPIDGVILCGGEVSRSFFQSLGCHSVRFTGSQAFGMAVGTMDHPRLSVVLAGCEGFPTLDTLKRVVGAFDAGG